MDLCPDCENDVVEPGRALCFDCLNERMAAMRRAVEKDWEVWLEPDQVVDARRGVDEPE
jgi:hypothetical protein